MFHASNILKCYKSYHHEDNNVILKKQTTVKTILDPLHDPGLYLT